MSGNAAFAPTVRVCQRGHRSEYVAGKHIPPFCDHICTAVFRTIRCNGWGQGRSADRMEIMCMENTVAQPPSAIPSPAPPETP